MPRTARSLRSEPEQRAACGESLPRPSEAPRLTIVNQYYTPDTASTGYLLDQLARTLAADGVQVEVLTSQPSYGPPETWRECPRRALVEGVDVVRLRTLRAGKDRLWGRLLTGLSFLASLVARQLFLASSQRIYLYCTNPPFLPFVGAFVSLCRRHAYVFLLHDAYPHIASLVGKLPPRGGIAWVWHRLNRWSLRRARAVIVLCDKAKELIARDYGISPQKIHVIHNWADDAELSPIPKGETAFAKREGLLEYFTLLYSGNLGLYYEFDSILAAAEQLAREPLRVVLIGAGGRRPAIEAEVARRGLTNVSLHPYQPFETLNDSLNSCDASLVTIARGVEGISFPSKLYTSLAVGKPIVAISEADSELRKIVESTGCGIWSEVGDVAGLMRGLRRLMGDPELCQRMGAAALATYQQRFTRAQAAGEYRAVIEECRRSRPS